MARCRFLVTGGVALAVGVGLFGHFAGFDCETVVISLSLTTIGIVVGGYVYAKLCACGPAFVERLFSILGGGFAAGIVGAVAAYFLCTRVFVSRGTFDEDFDIVYGLVGGAYCMLVGIIFGAELGQQTRRD